jgi:LmbE family N-acetylglucosaminyl deacetylase
MNKTFLVILSFLLISFMIQAQIPKKLNPSEIHHSIEKLNFLGSALYIAAHPDDENTRLISYLSNEIHARTAYLSITRGDGGQNLIGPEIRDLLGVIRTNELLQARLVDGGEQFFTRANDFGYSKHPDETLEIWNKEAVLSDVIRVIRTFHPDIIINRFNAESAGETHGHHTSSAILSTEAFDLAADQNYQVSDLKPWKAQRLFFNTSWWFYGSKENFDKADKSKMFEINNGVYFPYAGMSNSEIASLSRSKHKSQGFGSTGTRGDDSEYLQLLKGEMPNKSLFEGINTTWTRVKGGAAIGEVLQKVEKDFDFKNPSKSIPALVKAYSLIQDLEDAYWKKYKTEQIKEIILACAGLYLEGVASSPNTTPDSNITISIEAINRSNQEIVLKGISIEPENEVVIVNKPLKNNESFTTRKEVAISNAIKNTSPYWLLEPGTLGMYKVQDENLIGQPETPRALKLNFQLKIENEHINFTKNIVYKYNDPVKGEVYQPFEILPNVSSQIAAKVLLFDTKTPKEVPIKITAHKDGTNGISVLEVPDSWGVTPKEIPFTISKKGQEQTVVFTITPPETQSEGILKSVLISDGKTFDKSIVEIKYDHIPFQTVLISAEAKVVRLNLQKEGKEIAYIKGAGDEIPESLQQIGYNVSIIEPKDISSSILKNFDAVIVGIRAYNTVEELKFKQAILFDFVKNGGNMIVQYNTNHSLVTNDLAPFPLKLSRDRVTNENSAVSFISPKHEVLNYPNKITKEDFEGWVQERGLYFPNEWDTEFTPILSMNDKGEPAREGSLLVAKYGKGYYMYTGLSFFRELPAGVPGAFKLFTNMISIGKNKNETKVKN